MVKRGWSCLACARMCLACARKKLRKWKAFCRFSLSESWAKNLAWAKAERPEFSLRENWANNPVSTTYKRELAKMEKGSEFEDWKLRIEDFLPQRTKSKKVWREDWLSWMEMKNSTSNPPWPLAKTL
jgi:hypothetical protein